MPKGGPGSPCGRSRDPRRDIRLGTRVVKTAQRQGTVAETVAMASRGKEQQVHRGEDGIVSTRRNQVQQVGKAKTPWDQELPLQWLVQRTRT